MKERDIKDQAVNISVVDGVTFYTLFEEVIGDWVTEFGFAFKDDVFAGKFRVEYFRSENLMESVQSFGDEAKRLNKLI